MSYALLPSVSLMDAASTMASDMIDTQPNLQAFLQVYLNGGINPYAPLQPPFQGFFNLTNANLYGGDWSVVWGPCVYVDASPGSPGTATNSMYVAFSPSQNTYVVCIAGTNPLSSFDWIYEDFYIFPNYMAPWPLTLPFHPEWRITPIAPDIPAVSAATATGVSNLLMRHEMRDPNSGYYLGEFLKTKKNANATLIFVGHSLAGALAPPLALHLYPNPRTSGWNNVFVLSLAGATPGNSGFADKFIAAFLPTPDSTSTDLSWNKDYANHYDVVPHALDKLLRVVKDENNDGNYPSIWGVLQGPGLDTVGYAVSSAMEIGWFLADGYYSPIMQSWFSPEWGHFTGQNSPTWSPLPLYTNASPLSTWSDLATVIVAAHTDQYFKHFGVAPPPWIYKPALNTVSPEAAVFGRLPATRPRLRTGGLKGAVMGRRRPAAT